MLFLLSLSEVWAVLIPLFVMLSVKEMPAYLKPIKIYVWAALLFNLFTDAIDVYFSKHSNSVWLTNNNYLYNIHSIVRYFCYCVFFALLHQPFLVKLKRLIPFISAILVVINFLFSENFFHARTISSRLFATEAGILLFYCLQYFLFKQKEDSVLQKGSDFWIVTGLSIYVAFNFPFFLLYTSLSPTNQSFWWYIHNVTYIILCIFIARAFYVAKN